MSNIGILSNFQRPVAVHVQVDGKQVVVPDFKEHERWRWFVNDAITKLLNPGTVTPANTAVTPSAASVNISPNQNGGIFTNDGASGQILFNLPTAAVGLSFIFYVMAAQTLKVVATGGAKIRVTSTLSAANGHTQDNTTGDAITLVCVKANLWVAHPITGTWTTA